MNMGVCLDILLESLLIPEGVFVIDDISYDDGSNLSDLEDLLLGKGLESGEFNLRNNLILPD